MNDSLYRSYMNHFKTVVLPVANRRDSIFKKTAITIGVQTLTCILVLIILNYTVSDQYTKTVIPITVIAFAGGIALQWWSSHKKTQKIAAESLGALLSYYKGDVSYNYMEWKEKLDWLSYYPMHQFTFRQDGITVTNTYRESNDQYISVGFEVRWKHNLRNAAPLFILSDRTEKYLGKIGVFFQGFNSSRPALVHMENKQFEHLFRVYSQNQDFLERTLTPEAQRVLAEWRAAKNIQIYISYDEVAVHYKTDRELFIYDIHARHFKDQQQIASLYHTHKDALKIKDTLRRIFGNDFA